MYVQIAEHVLCILGLYATVEINTPTRNFSVDIHSSTSKCCDLKTFDGGGVYMYLVM